MSTEYELVKDEDGELVCCECCGWPASTAEFPSRMDGGKTMHRLCEVCAQTNISLGFHYTHGYPHHDIG